MLSAPVYSFQQSTTITEIDYPRFTLDSKFSKAELPMRGTFKTCFLVNLTAQNKIFTVTVDTGSPDTTLPRTGLTGYNGASSLDLALPSSGGVSATYSDGTSWSGFIVRMPVAATIRLNITASDAPVVMITSQSTSPVFISGTNSQGTMGLAFKKLTATTTSPFSVVDAWFAAGVIPRNQIAFYGCPNRKSNESWIDFGNETPVTKCGNKSATLYMPDPSFVNIEVLQILVAGIPVTLPTNFQSSNSTKTYSIMNSCSPASLLPTTVHAKFLTALVASGGFSADVMNFARLQDWLSGTIAIKLTTFDITYSKLPNITFSLSSGVADGKMISLTLGPKQYIEIDSSGFCNNVTN